MRSLIVQNIVTCFLNMLARGDYVHADNLKSSMFAICSFNQSLMLDKDERDALYNVFYEMCEMANKD